MAAIQKDFFLGRTPTGGRSSSPKAPNQEANKLTESDYNIFGQFVFRASFGSLEIAAVKEVCHGDFQRAPNFSGVMGRDLTRTPTAA
jgi:hypothetical protein